MTLQDLHIGQKVRDKHTKWEFVIIGLWTSVHNPDHYVIYCDFEENEADPWEYTNIEDLELV